MTEFPAARMLALGSKGPALCGRVHRSIAQSKAVSLVGVADQYFNAGQALHALAPGENPHRLVISPTLALLSGLDVVSTVSACAAALVVKLCCWSLRYTTMSNQGNGSSR